MKKFNNIFFDFDGTICDTKKGIIKSILYTIKSLNNRKISHKEITKRIGLPLNIVFSTILQTKNKTTINKHISIFRNHYKKTGLYSGKLFKGIKDLIKDLKFNSKHLYIVTNKPKIFVKSLLKLLDIEDYFDVVQGSNIKNEKFDKTQRLNKVIKANNISVKESCLVGDHAEDIKAAQKNKIFSIGVLYGYGDKHELELAGADVICANIKVLRKLIL